VVKNPDELRGADVAKAARQRVTRIPNVVVHRDRNRCASTEVQIGIVSALCQMTPKSWVNTVVYGDTATHIVVG